MRLYEKLAACAAGTTLCVFLAACGGGGGGGFFPPPAQSKGQAQILPLSTRADMVSGGSALVEIKMPTGSSTSAMKVTLGSADVTTAFKQTRGDGRTVGLVTGLANGANTLKVTSTDDSFRGASLTLTNHPIGGPVLVSTQVTPWVCATPVPTAATASTAATNASGLSTTATDAQCNIATETKLFYRTLTPQTAAAGDGGCSFLLPDPSPTIANPNPSTPSSSCLQPYVPGTTPMASVATTTPLGATAAVPYIVRVERGTVNRGIFDIAVLFDPAKPWTANAPQAQWTGKVVYSFGASTGQPRLQFRTEQNWADDSALSRGVMVVDNSLTDSLYNSNRILAGETVMMMKEYITKYYGEIKYTMGNGCSGGSIGQNTVASTFPGLLDGIQVQCDYPDSITTGIEVADCVQLVNFYAGAAWGNLVATEGLTQAQINAKKTAINGHLDQTGCHSWVNSFGYNNKPGNYTPTFVADAAGHLVAGPSSNNNCKLPPSQVYDPVTNPTGPRCGDPDLAVAVWGLAPGTTRANQTNDNVGVQYGLKALLSGAINAEEFVTLNEGVGGSDADSNLTTTRSVADAAGLQIAYQSGIVSSGAQLSKLPIIDLRGYDEGGIHYIWRSFAERDRLDQDGGGHGNQVMWRFGTGLVAPAPLTLQSFLMMDTWLSSLVTTAPKATLNSERTSAQVLASKPSTAFDYCYLSTDTTFSTKVTDQAICDADPKLAIHSSPRQVSGGPRAENILKCTLKPLNFGEYPGITFTGTQQGRLQAVFSTGVCDYTKPGVGQQAPASPRTYVGGPGGVPLTAAPQSTPI
ncbi:DUF6351 family protein [Variovorax sp. J2P1-59]|uniref:DUF6351 family protein n=1 Tax=Variovorax flavidus TaxID=3053501 RepID=UPI002578DFA2|nr:DUF6351 family protein [Variovorax sp. J2P1-59]MDM0074073.1 DUF6351 family protein [Variovorax sp. J2P1-59]